MCLESGGDLRAPSPDYRASSDTEGARLVPSGGRRRSWFKRMFSRDSDSGSLSRSQSHVDLDKIGENLGIPFGKPQGKLQPLKKAEGTKKKRSKSVAAVAVEFPDPDANDKTSVKIENAQEGGEQCTAIKDNRKRPKSARGRTVGSLKSRSLSVCDGDNHNPLGDNSLDKSDETFNNSKQKRKRSIKFKGLKIKISKSDCNANDVTDEQRDDESALEEKRKSRLSAKRDKRSNSISRLAKAFVQLKKKPKGKQNVDETPEKDESEVELDTSSYNMEVENERSDKAAWEEASITERTGSSDESYLDTERPGIRGSMFPDDESDTWDSDAEDEELMRIKNSSPVSNIQDIFCVAKGDQGVSYDQNDGNINSKHKDLNQWYKETTADIKNKATAACEEKTKQSINEKVRKFTEKITQNITDTEECDLVGGQGYSKDSQIVMKKEFSYTIFDNVKNEINDGKIPQIVIETDDSENDHDAKYIKLSAEEQFRYTFSGPIEIDESDEELHEIGKSEGNKNNQKQYIPKNIIETDESKDEVDHNKVTANVTETNSKSFPANVIETDSDDDSNDLNNYNSSDRGDHLNVHAYTRVNGGSNEAEDEEVDEVDGNVFEAHHVKAAKQTINCLMCSR